MLFVSQIYPAWFLKYSGFSKSMRKIEIPRRIIQRAVNYGWDLTWCLKGYNILRYWNQILEGYVAYFSPENGGSMSLKSVSKMTFI
jgi:hypothetical protein